MKETTKDIITNLTNRAYFEESLRGLISDRIFSGVESHLLLADADKFKSVNDNISHLVGDQYLRFLAELMSGPKIGFHFSRTGGDEFIGTYVGSKDEALKRAKSLLSGFGDARFNFYSSGQEYYFRPSMSFALVSTALIDPVIKLLSPRGENIREEVQREIDTREKQEQESQKNNNRIDLGDVYDLGSNNSVEIKESQISAQVLVGSLRNKAQTKLEKLITIEELITIEDFNVFMDIFMNYRARQPNNKRYDLTSNNAEQDIDLAASFLLKKGDALLYRAKEIRGSSLVYENGEVYKTNENGVVLVPQ